LAALGCVVTTAISGEQALAALCDAAQVDLLLTDIALGAGMRGTELARQAQVRRPGLPVLLMSGFTAEMLEPNGEQLTWELPRKPYTRGQLSRALARALRDAR